MNIVINNVYDIFSSIVLLYNYDFIFRIFYGQYKYFICFYFVILFEQNMKKTLTHSSLEILKRPQGACDCDLFNSGGDVSGQCGFPSGHVITTSFYFYLLYFENRYKYNHFKKYNKLFLILIHIPIFLVGYGRIMKKCHNLFQVCGGYIFGMFFAFLFY